MIKFSPGPHPETGQDGYILEKDYVILSTRYGRRKSLKKGMWSDGATGFIDLGAKGFWAKCLTEIKLLIHPLGKKIKSAWFFVHDAFCNGGLWDLDGLTNPICFEELHVWKKHVVHYPKEEVTEYMCVNCGRLENLDAYRITNWQASMVAMDVLRKDGWYILAPLIAVATFFGGGGEARKNGMIKLKG